MAMVSDKPQTARLKQCGVDIQTEFWDEGGCLRLRSTDGAHHDDVVNGIVLTKKYFQGGRPVHRETEFNPMMMYTYIANGELSREQTCPNCGWTATVADFVEGCPYCGTCYNVEYTARRQGGKFHADKNMKDIRLYLGVLIAALAVCLSVSFAVVGLTGRTFNVFDKLKAVAYGVLPALALFALFFSTHAFVITRRAEEKYQRQTALIRRFESDLLALDLRLYEFYTNLSSELALWCYGDDVPGNRDVVDFDVLDYDDYAITTDGQGRTNLSVTLRLRRVRAGKGGVTSDDDRLRVDLRPTGQKRDALGPGVNLIRCPGCGASIDIMKPACPQCGTRIHYRQRLYITEVTRV